MGEFVGDPVSYVEARYGIQLKRKTRDEWVGPCPLGCGGAGKDRFILFDDGPDSRVWCRQCGKFSYLGNIDKMGKITEHDKLVMRMRSIEKRQDETERRLTALEEMAKSTAHLVYHNNLQGESYAHWLAQGMTPETIENYLLGYCDRCPTDDAGRSSYTIPIIEGGTLQNIRHRLVGAQGGDKYRPHMAGLGSQLFNADVLAKKPKRVLLLEGGKKVLVTQQFGFDCVGICGCRNFKTEWMERFAPVREVVVALDPDAMDSAVKLAGLFNGRGRVARLPAKIDDMLVHDGATAQQIERFLSFARPVS